MAVPQAPAGAGLYFDSVSDRLTDGMLFGGVAWYLRAPNRAASAMLPVAIMGLAMFISYQRPRPSRRLGCQGGIMERAERIVVLAALLFPELLIATLWVMLVLTATRPAVREGLEAGHRRARSSHPARRARRRPRTRTSVEPLWRQRMRERREARNG